MTTFEPVALDYPKHVAERARSPFRSLAENLPVDATVAYSNGAGPWNRFITADTGLCASIVRSGSIETVRQPSRYHSDWRGQLEWVFTQISDLFVTHEDIIFGSTELWGPVDSAVILRPHSVIVLNGRRMSDDARQNFYVPSPIATGHELIDDLDGIGRLFPGRFRFPEGKNGHAGAAA